MHEERCWALMVSTLHDALLLLLLLKLQANLPA